MNNITIVNTTGNHYKFWTAEIMEPTGNKFSRSLAAIRVLCSWGRIGANGQSKVFFFDDVTSAREYVAKKVNEKLSCGYRVKAVAA